MTQKVIIDADPGIGDAVAVVLAMLDPDIDVIGITATAGVVSGHQATRNVQSLVELIDPRKWPRIGGCDASAADVGFHFGGNVISRDEMHGANGLGAFRPQVADLHHPRESAKLIVDLVRENPHAVTLLTLGPLTNVAVAFEVAPELPDILNGIVCVGGSVDYGGDVGPASEFNIFSNPEAARIVLRSPASKTLLPLDASSRGVVTFSALDHLSSLAASRIESALGDMLQYWLRAHHEYLGFEGVRLNEFVGLAAVTRPNLFEGRSMEIDVEVLGELTRGMTVFDRRGTEQWQTSIDVLETVDSAGVVDYFHYLLRRADRTSHA